MKERVNGLPGLERCVFCLVLSFVVLSGTAFAQPDCGSSITSSVTLNLDIFCRGSGLLITADNVVLDCAGYQITYAMSEAGDGITVMGSNVTITGCIIQQGSPFPDSAGVVLTSNSNGLIKDNSITTLGEKGIAVLLTDSDFNRIIGNTMRSEGGASYSFASFQSSNNEIVNSTLETRGNASSAVLVQVGGNNKFTGDTITVRGDNSYGVQFRSTASGTISNNAIMVASASSSAIAVGFGANYTSISGNSMVLRGDIDTGVLVSKGAYTSLVLNTIDASGSNVAGAFVVDSPSTQFLGNLVSADGTGVTGLLMSSSPSSNVDQNLFSVVGQNSTAVSIRNCSDCSMSKNNVSKTGSEGWVTLLFSLTNSSIANNTITSVGNEVALQLFNSTDINITDNALSSGSSCVTVDFSSGINLFRNVLGAAAISNSRCLFVNNSILGGSPKIITSGDTQLLLNDNSYGNYWGRVSSPFFVSGVDVDNGSFSDFKPLSREYSPQRVSQGLLSGGSGPLIAAVLLLAFAAIAAYMIRRTFERKKEGQGGSGDKGLPESGSTVSEDEHSQ